MYKLVFSGNESPFKNPSSNILEKAYYIPLNKSIEPEIQDKNLIYKLIPEIPAIINKGLKSLEEVKNRDDLEFKFTEEEINKIMSKFIDPYKFIFDKLGLHYEELNDPDNDNISLDEYGYYIPSIDELNQLIKETAKEKNLQIQKDGYGSYKKHIAEYLEKSTKEIKNKTIRDNNNISKVYLNLYIKKDNKK
jgi:phage/plasmid-associated DNA primase